jgi:diguanylate cyclase (GGDEF)-like protein
MEKDIKRLQEELEKARSQLYIFYELTKAMRTTLHLDEIAYIILTGLTAHQGLAFNRAILFLTDKEFKNITGFMGIGPMDSAEADTIWRNIEDERKDLYDLIETYHRIKEGKIKLKFMDFIRSLSFPINEENGFLLQTLSQKNIVHIKKENIKHLKNSSLAQKLQLKEFIAAPLWIKNKPAGIIIIDNYITQKPITEEDIKILNMFVNQASGAIENSQSFEDTLIKASTDPLTSLWNYRYFQHKLDKTLLTAKTQNHPISIMMIDIDNFKKFNDTYGHISGNAALQGISRLLKENCRKFDTLCRYGGEEFSLILPHTNKENAYLLGERMRKSIEVERIIEDVCFTVSIGISSFPQDAREKELFIQKADQALYQAKRNGKNQVILA